ncbi:MAG: chemotaxis protein CheW [Acidobacteriota bacterium]
MNISTNLNTLTHLVVFKLDESDFGIDLAVVEGAIRAVSVTPLPKAPEIVSGVINARGRIIPVVNLRKRFRLPEREPEIEDRLLIVHTATRAFAFVVDAVSGVLEITEPPLITADTILPDLEYLQGVLKLKDGLILIHDLNRFLSLEEEQVLNEVLH